MAFPLRALRTPDSLHARSQFPAAHSALVFLTAITLSCALCGCTSNPSPPSPLQPSDQSAPQPPQEVPSSGSPNSSIPDSAAPTSQTAETPATASTAQNTPTPIPPTSDDVRREVLPGIWVNRAQRIIDFDGTIAIDAHNPQTPIVYLEWIVCSPDTKEHESLVITNIKPSHLHAALLLLNLEPGSPGQWKWEGATLSSVPPRGDVLHVYVQPLTSDQTPDPVTPPLAISQWIIGKPKAGQRPVPLHEHWPQDTFLFAGSTLAPATDGTSRYKADVEGGLIGLTTFGHEVIVWSRMFNPDSGIEAPYWIADSSKVPQFATPVRVYISPHPIPFKP